MKHTAFIGLGSNLADPLKQLQQALAAIDEAQGIELVSCSSYYASQPMGPQDQPDYVNAVCELRTTLTPQALLEAMQTIELEQGRERKDERWGPRTLDLDILLYDNLQIATETLTIPHYGMKEREFVLYPLAEIAADLVLPCGESLKSVLNTCAVNGLQQIQQSDVRC